VTGAGMSVCDVSRSRHVLGAGHVCPSMSVCPCDVSCVFPLRDRRTASSYVIESLPVKACSRPLPQSAVSATGL